MTCRGRSFLDGWVAEHLSAGEPQTASYPTPAAALAALRLQAHGAGISECELQAGMGDPVAAVTDAMVAAPPPGQALDAPAQGGSARNAVEAIQLSISYLDGFRDVVGSDTTLAAQLVLRHLKQQGFALLAFKHPATTGYTSQAERPPGYDPVAIPCDVRPGLQALFGSPSDE